MSLFGALGTAVSGLNAQSAAFSNISDNIANSQTVGFKGTNTAFIDYVTDTSATANDSGSVQAIPLYQNNIQGSISQNNNPLSFAINGQGFLPVSAATSTTGGTAGTTTSFDSRAFYTRAGDFQLNKSGYLVNSAGFYLNGWAVNDAGQPDRNAVAPIQVTQSTDKPVATSKINLSANLPTNDGTIAASTKVSSQINIYDAQGVSHTLTLQFQPFSSDGTTVTPNMWTMTAYDGDPTGSTAPNVIGDADITFAADGTMTTLTVPSAYPGLTTSVGGYPTGTSPSTSTSGASANVPLDTWFGSAAATTNHNNNNAVPNGTTTNAYYQQINLNLGDIAGTAGLTQFASTGTTSTYTLNGVTQDGVPPGAFSSLTNQANGDIVANYDNGQSRVVARVPVITFPSPDSLQRQNGSAYTATTAAGTPLARDSNSNGAGALEASSIEASNVDIGTQFTNLIIAQRAYSANAKLVTTADQLLQTTIDMKQ